MLKVLEAAGATIIDTPFTGLSDYLASTNSTIVSGADFRTDLKKYLDELSHNPQHITSEAVLRNWTMSHPQEMWSPTSRDVARWNISLGLGYGNKSPQFWRAYQANLYLGGEATLLGAIRRNGVDAVVLPTAFAPGVSLLLDPSALPNELNETDMLPRE